MTSLKNRNFLKLLDFTSDEITYLLDLSAKLKNDKYTKTEKQMLKGKNIALIFEKTSTRTRCAFEVCRFRPGSKRNLFGPYRVSNRTKGINERYSPCFGTNVRRYRISWFWTNHCRRIRKICRCTCLERTNQ